MKAPFFVASALLVCGSAAADSTLWQYHLPETGVLPSAFSASWMSQMGARHGHGSLGWQQTSLTLPLADPRRTQVGEYYINVACDIDRTELNNHGSLPVVTQVFWDIALPVTVIHPMAGGHRLAVGAVPHLATDFEHAGHSFEPGCFVDYLFVKTETFSLSAGLAAAPLQSEYGVLPFVSAEWKPEDSAWRYSWKGFEGRAMYCGEAHIPDVGFFVRAAGGSWAAETPGGSRLLRVRSLVAGVSMQVPDVDGEGNTKSMIFCDLGASIITRASFSKWSDRGETVHSTHYHPGVYVSAGVDFRF